MSGERLEYEWPDLPPIDQIKTAITRRRVSMGMNYVLPVDKTKNSVENVYRTNLRVMFQEPYLQDVGGYNEARLKSSVSHHLQTNTVPSAFRGRKSDYTRYKLNSESEKVRKAYSHSAPPHGLTGKTLTADSKQLQPRSNLYLPLKTRLPEEAVKLKKEAEKILKSVQEDDDLYDPDRDDDLRNAIGTHIDDLAKDRSRSHPKLDANPVPFFKKTSKFKDYEDLKNTKVSPKPEFPETIESPFLSHDKNLEIWDWLTKDEVVTEFTHFMSICS